MFLRFQPLRKSHRARSDDKLLYFSKYGLTPSFLAVETGTSQSLPPLSSLCASTGVSSQCVLSAGGEGIGTGKAQGEGCAEQVTWPD